MHDLSDSGPPEGLLDGAVLNRAVLDDCIIHDVLSGEERSVLAALLIGLAHFWLDVVVNIPEDVVGAFADEHFHHLGVADFHGDFERRGIAVGRVGRAVHLIQDVSEYFDFSGVDCGMDHGDVAEDGVHADLHLFL